MSHARKPRPRPPRPPRKRRLPDWLRDSLGPAAQLLAISVAAAVLNGVGVAPVTGPCPESGSRPSVVAVVRDDGGRMPESEPSTHRSAEVRDGLTWADVVGRDGIEPPTLRFSAARSTD
jgi:hypothetical protein